MFLWFDCNTINFLFFQSTIHTTVDRSGFSALKHLLFGPPKMHRNLLQDRENVFCIAACKLKVKVQ